MRNTDQQVSDLKMTNVQKFALLLVGGLATVGESEDGFVTVATSARSNSNRQWFWAGTHKYWSENHKKTVTIRAKTFRALANKGLLVAQDTLAFNVSFGVQLTAVGWDVFDTLARRNQREHDAWQEKLEVLTAEEAVKGDTHRVQVVCYREVKVTKFQMVCLSAEVTATDPASLKEAAEKEFAGKDPSAQTWYEDWEAEKNWGGYAKERKDRIDVVCSERSDIKDQGVLASQTPIKRARIRLAQQVEEPRTITGIKGYVKNGDRAPEIRKIMAEGFGGRILDMDLEDGFPEDNPVEAGADLDRFQFIMDDE